MMNIFNFVPSRALNLNNMDRDNPFKDSLLKLSNAVENARLKHSNQNDSNQKIMDLIQDIQRKIAILKEQKDDLSKSLEVAESQCQTHKDELSVALADNRQIYDQRSAHDVEIQNLKQQIQELETNSSNKSSEINNLNQKLDEIQQEKKQLDNDFDETKLRYATLLSETEKWEKYKNDTIQEIKAITNALNEIANLKNNPSNEDLENLLNVINQSLSDVKKKPRYMPPKNTHFILPPPQTLTKNRAAIHPDPLYPNLQTVVDNILRNNPNENNEFARKWNDVLKNKDDLNVLENYVKQHSRGQNITDDVKDYVKNNIEQIYDKNRPTGGKRRKTRKQKKRKQKGGFIYSTTSKRRSIKSKFQKTRYTKSKSKAKATRR